jgi:hypothetical protein
MDFSPAKSEQKIRTFTVYAFDNQKTDLKTYFQSQLKLMKETAMTVLETGRKTIDDNASYYVVTRDTIDNNPVNQLFRFTDYFTKRYTVQLATTATSDPINELCKSMWLINKIKLARD